MNNWPEYEACLNLPRLGFFDLTRTGGGSEARGCKNLCETAEHGLVLLKLGRMVDKALLFPNK